MWGSRNLLIQSYLSNNLFFERLEQNVCRVKWSFVQDHWSSRFLDSVFGIQIISNLLSDLIDSFTDAASVFFLEFVIDQFDLAITSFVIFNCALIELQLYIEMVSIVWLFNKLANFKYLKNAIFLTPYFQKLRIQKIKNVSGRLHQETCVQDDHFSFYDFICYHDHFVCQREKCKSHGPYCMVHT